jgi:hypothetical protein
MSLASRREWPDLPLAFVNVRLPNFYSADLIRRKLSYLAV